MDLKDFKDVDISKDDSTNKVPLPVDKKNITETEDESHQVLKELEARLSKIKEQEQQLDTESPKEEKGDAESAELDPTGSDRKEYEDLYQPTFLEKMQPFIIPICLTLFAIIFAGLFLYFFSKSRVENTAQAIINQGVPEQVVYPTTPVPVQVIVNQEPVVCEEPEILNEAKDGCITATTTIVTPEVVKMTFENGTTTIVNVRFSFDKFNYDNSPRGIYLNDDQIFEGEYGGHKLYATNRAFANDFFFGIDRYMVSLIGSCSYVVDEASILVKNMNEKENYFIGTVVKVVDSSKPRVVCK